MSVSVIDSNSLDVLEMYWIDNYFTFISNKIAILRT